MIVAQVWQDGRLVLVVRPPAFEDVRYFVRDAAGVYENALPYITDETPAVHNGDTVTIGSDTYTIGRYDDWNNWTELIPLS